MVFDIFQYFIALLLSFFLFYFNSPYWEGQGMADMSHSGLWRMAYRVLSTLGYWLYKCYALLFGWLGRSLRRIRVPEAVVHLLDILAFIGIFYGISACYGSLMNSFFPMDLDALTDDSGLVYNKICKALAFVRVLDGYMGGGFSVGKLFSAFFAIIWALIRYTVINVIYFSTIYGFLKPKLQERSLVHYMPTPSVGIGPLFKDILASIGDFLTSMTYVRTIANPLVLGLFIAVVFVFSVVVTVTGQNELTLWQVILQVLDEIQLVPIIASYLVTFTAGRVSEIAATAVVNKLPEGMQESIHNLSDSWNKSADDLDENRAEWAEEHDISLAGIDNDAHGSGGPIHRMDLH